MTGFGHKAIPYSPDAYRLLHNGVRALAVLEANGLRIDEQYLVTAIVDTKEKIAKLQEELNKSNVAKKWRKIYRAKTNFNSTHQLGQILYNHMGYTPEGTTKTEKFRTDEKALSAIDDPFVKKYLEIKKLQKAVTTYLIGIQREVVGGRLHPFFSLHTALTYRSSSEAPNFQNMPIRVEEISRLIRRAFIPRRRHHIVEIDYSGAEVKVAACYHKDPNMISYINDKERDMHRDMAQECFLLSDDDLSKNDLGDKKNGMGKKIRYCGKNMFVFPQFYGDWYKDCARSLWDALSTFQLVTASGIPLKKHLRKKGILKLGQCNPNEQPAPNTFEQHLQEVERSFWEDRFPVYAQWKRNWYAKYKRTGWLISKTGFVCQGFMKRNEVINYPVQGSAFHCLLWSLIRLVLQELPKRKMKTLIVGQIHDSIVADVPHEELDDFIYLAKDVMTKQIVKAWPWLIVPMEIEADVAPIGASWAEKEEYKLEK